VEEAEQNYGDRDLLDDAGTSIRVGLDRRGDPSEPISGLFPVHPRLLPL